jgi:curved DNA-binding protein CbpA
MPNEQYKQFNCYRILGTSHSASLQEIRAAYKQASLRSHPDRGGSHDAMVRVNSAYQVLSNPIERQAHDIYWKTFTTKSNNASPPRTNNVHQSTTKRKTEAQQQTQSKYREAPKKEPLVGLKNRIYQQIEQEKARIWQDLNNRAKRYEISFKQSLSNKRQEALFTFIGAIVLAAIAISFQFTILWIGVVILGLSFLSTLGGIQIENRSFSIFDINPNEKFREHAQNTAKESCAKDVSNLDRHFSSLASLAELLLRTSTYDDSEEQVARRITGAFFLMGYMPLNYDSENRTILFTDGEENILIRFRHRSGIATNITYVEKLVSLMSRHGASQGYLFCSPGLSGNAASYANSQKVKWYRLETMNHWIDEVLMSDYSGPSGDILRNLDSLRSFIATLSPMLTARKPASRYRYRRYRY